VDDARIARRGLEFLDPSDDEWTVLWVKTVTQVMFLL